MVALGFGEMIGAAEQSEPGSEQIGFESWPPMFWSPALYLPADQGESLGEPAHDVQSGPAPGEPLGDTARWLPDESGTCRLRLSPPLGTIVVLDLGTTLARAAFVRPRTVVRTLPVSPEATTVTYRWRRRIDIFVHQQHGARPATATLSHSS